MIDTTRLANILARATLAAAFALIGCARPPRDGDRAPIAVVTAWPRSERAALEARFREWAEKKDRPTDPAIRIRWIVLDFHRDPARYRRRIPSADVFLGGSGPSVASDSGRNDRNPSKDGFSYFAIERFFRDSSENRERGIDRGDPRRDAEALAFARERIARRGWSRGYADLVEAVGASGRIVGLGALEPGKGVRSIEGVWIASAAFQRSGVRLFGEFLRETAGVEADSTRPIGGDLLADFLGSTLIDADLEARRAWRALERTGRPARWIKRFESAPPWPPASILKLKRKRSETGTDPQPLLDALAAQIAPDPSARAWLSASWRREERPIDEPFLEELRSAADGRLDREPRFREWLRAEWTASSRRRREWIARHAGEDF